ncbi:MAG: hypothetical protein ACOYM7_09610 [Paludibacter sp.]
MKTMRNFISRRELLKATLLVALLLVSVVIFAQDGGTHPGYDPELPPDGMSVPIDGGILMAILAGGSLVTMLFKRKKKEE